MDIAELLKGDMDCECGRAHECPIDFVKIGKGAIKEFSELCAEYKNIILVSDANTYRVCGSEIESLIKNKIEKSLVLRENGDVVIPNEEKLSEIEECITDDTDLIMGVGSGVINDLCKYVSFKHNLPYYIAATAPSMDGYASVGAALILNGMKVTLNARPPKAIIADTGVLKEAPMDMLRAGYGDIIGKYSCLNDWKLAALVHGEYFCQKVYDITFEAARRVRDMSEGILKRDEKTVGALMEALVTVGIAMSYVNNSRPASGSEHHLSHFFEITGILDGKPYLPHGIDVAFSAVAVAKLREAIIKSMPEGKEFDREEWKMRIKRIYSSSADEVISLQDKLGWYKREDESERKWEEIKKILVEAPSAAEFEDMLSCVGLYYKDFERLYGKDKINDAIFYAKDLKDRYSVLWLNYLFFKKEI